MKRVLFNRKDIFEILNLTPNMMLSQVGSLWGEAWLTQDDIELIEISNLYIEIL